MSFSRIRSWAKTLPPRLSKQFDVKDDPDVKLKFNEFHIITDQYLAGTVTLEDTVRAIISYNQRWNWPNPPWQWPGSHGRPLLTKEDVLALAAKMELPSEWLNGTQAFVTR